MLRLKFFILPQFHPVPLKPLEILSKDPLSNFTQKLLRVPSALFTFPITLYVAALEIVNGMTTIFSTLSPGARWMLVTPLFTATYDPLEATGSETVCQLLPTVPHSASSHILVALPSLAKAGYPVPHH